MVMAVLIGTAQSEDDPQFSDCSHPYYCEPMLGDVWYPFWGNKRPQYCGDHQPFELQCHSDNNGVYSTIDINSVTYRVLNINQSDYTMNLVRNDLWEKHACIDIKERVNTTLSGTPFNYPTTPRLGNLTLFYGCNDPPPSSLQPLNKFTCNDNNGELVTGFYTTEDTKCDDAQTIVQVPILNDSMANPLRRGFIINYGVNNLCLDCINSEGTCGSSNSTSSDFLCFCKDQPYFQKCPVKGAFNLKIKLFIGASTSAVAIFFFCIIMICIRKGTSSITSMVFPRKLTKQDHNVEAFIRNHGFLAPTRHNYSQVKRITNNFKDKLGEGGFGAVYKGKLPNGRLVAVKVLKSSKGNGEEFINEVASISRTSHVNIVSLLGYCFEGRKKALIYEFMPNGSLEKFIFSNDTTVAPSFHLDWEKLYQIATGIARGLEYLHRGCNTRILHFDIKPHNILLDHDFSPKIADFGLAKLCLGKESVISMLGARGTIGYIAPELCCRNFGGVSHKSDVYSYGMMILEMVGGRKNLYVGVSNTSEIYFPDWIYNKLVEGKDVKLHGVVSGEDNAVSRKMILVGLWCIQTNPSDRPSMSRVIKMLEGSTGTLQVPPKPYLSSPARVPMDSSIASSQDTSISVL